MRKPSDEVYFVAARWLCSNPSKSSGTALEVAGSMARPPRGLAHDHAPRIREALPHGVVFERLFSPVPRTLCASVSSLNV